MPRAGHRYDAIGRTYARTRQEEPSVAAAIRSAIGAARTVVNVGAGSGNYEPTDLAVVGVEPSEQMLAQRLDRAPAVRGVAEALPFPDQAFDVALAVLTVHHWADPAAGLRELGRVASRQVILYFEPLRDRGFWALDYFPAALDLPTEIDPPGKRLLGEQLELREVRPVLVPHDCRDGFGIAYWARPERYLEPDVQAGMSFLAMLRPEDRAEGTARLRADLESGEWDRRHGHLRTQDTYDGGYRLALCG